MSDGTRALLRQGTAPLGLNLSEHQLEQLDDFLHRLQRWNATYNLTAVTDERDMVVSHLLDCLAAVPALMRQAPQAHALLDVGSGGGLPGAVLAIACPRLRVTCVDAVGKKAAFLQQLVGSLGLRNLTSRHARVESLKADQTFDVITARAFSSLANFVELTRPLLARQGIWMAMKGQDPVAERVALPHSVTVFHVEPLGVPGLEAQRCLVWMRPAEEAA